MLNILRLRSCVRSRSGQLSQWSLFTFCALGSVRGPQRGHTHPKCLRRCPQRTLHKYEEHRKTSGSRSGHKRSLWNKSYKHAVQHMFLGHFARRYRWRESFDPMTSSNLFFDGGQVNLGPIFKLIFLYKKHMFLARIFLGIPNMPLVYFYDS